MHDTIIIKDDCNQVQLHREILTGYPEMREVVDGKVVFKLKRKDNILTLRTPDDADIPKLEEIVAKHIPVWPEDNTAKITDLEKKVQDESITLPELVKLLKLQAPLPVETD